MARDEFKDAQLENRSSRAMNIGYLPIACACAVIMTSNIEWKTVCLFRFVDQILRFVIYNLQTNAHAASLVFILFSQNVEFFLYGEWPRNICIFFIAPHWTERHNAIPFVVPYTDHFRWQIAKMHLKHINQPNGSLNSFIFWMSNL